uniref:B30.2/SPRY domain-containing protein n=1 Tax=Astyanax mexicanus TaxID=7994 RepID=A0A8B9R9D4_ASTMX
MQLILRNLMRSYPVVLDPNTANSFLSISADLSSVSISENHQLQIPDNPERFSVFNGVLGSEGFSSGTHSWEVEVEGSDDWVVGVAEESVNRNIRVRANPANGFYCIWRKDGKIVAGLNSVEKTIAKPAVHGIVVILNWDKGKVTFSSAENNELLYTFKNKFKKKMYPYFYNKSKTPLKIQPIQTSITDKI